MRLERAIPTIVVFIVFTLILLPGATAAEEEKGVYTLKKSIDEAMSKSWRLRAKQEKIDQAYYLKDQTRADFLPKLGMSYGYTRQSEERKSRFFGMESTVSPKDNFQWRGSVRQPLFTGFALTSSYRLAELGIDLSEMNLELEKLDLSARVKEAYFNILVADKAVEVAQKEVESLKSNVNVARSFFNVGMIPINDLLKAEVELANAEQNLVKARNTADLTRAAFNTILVRPIDEPVQLEDILSYRPEKGEYAFYLKRAFDERPELKVLDINILQADQQIRLAKSKNYPEISLTYDYIKEGDSADVSGSPYHDASKWEAMAVLSWTFWEWGKTYYTGKEKESAKQELMETKLSLEDSIRLEVKDALSALEVAEKNIPTTQKAVEQAEENLRVNEERYKAQVTTITEVLDAQALLTRARVNYYRSLYDQNLARARLERAIGAY
ncbi:MAG: TolC family protein [Pseudomonadota bacterium]